MKKIKILTIILAIILISMVGFVGVYVKEQNRMENQVKDYSLLSDLSGERTVRLTVNKDSEEVIKDSEGNVVETEEELTDEQLAEKGYTKESVPNNSQEVLNVDNYNKTKEVIEKRLKRLGVQEYEITVDENTGDIILRLPENSNTDTIISNIYTVGKFEIVDSETEEVLINNDDIKLMEDTKSAIYNTSDTYGDGKIIFIDIPDQDKPVSIGNAGDIVVIGNNPDKKPTVIRSASNLNDAGNKRLVLANLIIDMPNSVDNKGEVVKNGFVANSPFSELTLDNCDILMNETNPLIQVTAAGKGISNINIENCKINIPAGNSSRYIVSTAGVETTVDKLNFRNNIVYCDNGMVTTFRLVNSQNDQTKTTIKDIVIENNTLSNICYNNSAMVIALNIDQATVTKNLVYFNTSSWSAVTQQYHCILRAYGNYPATAYCTDNIAYYDQSVTTGITGDNAGGRYYFRIFQNNSFKPTTGSAEEFELISSDPFSGGDIATFTPSGEYSGYGSDIAR